MKKKIDIKKRIKLLSWTSLIGLFILTSLSVYNAIAYVKNLEQVKTIVELLNNNTSNELKQEVIKAVETSISNSQIVLLLSAVIGLGLLFLVVYLGVTIKKETDRRIHAMDWIIED